MDGETVFSIVLGAALAVFSLVVVGYSFIRRREDGGPVVEAVSDGPSAELTEGPSIDSIYDSIYTLELEYHLGNLPEEQFREQFQAYRLQAAAALKERLEGGGADPLSLLERQVTEVRAAMRQNGPPTATCPDCSGPVPVDAANCVHCGAELSPQTSASSVSASADETN